MLPTSSDWFHVISDGFDSFVRDLHAFRRCPPPEICQVEKNIIENLKVLEKISVDQIHSGGEGESRVFIENV